MALLWTGSGDVLEICSDDDSAETSIPVGSFGMISDTCGMSIGNTSKMLHYNSCFTSEVWFAQTDPWMIPLLAREADWDSPCNAVSLEGNGHVLVCDLVDGLLMQI